MSCKYCDGKYCYTEEQDAKRWDDAVAYGKSVGIEEEGKRWATAVHSLQDTVKRLKESNAIIVKLAGLTEEDVNHARHSRW